ncbi:hypothetical protein AB0L83_28300 [Streptomyces sp. NPDC052071]|nr:MULTISPECIES: hypothetical protein [Streptomyces]MYT58907.1 hypothetical protein [Streptomyces sp. SID7834]TPM98792.1 hypothetical protein FKO01_51455 [Mesorhizobium sp. B2-3-3]
MAILSPDGDYSITTMYSVPDDAWYLELDLVATRRTVVTAIVPDEDPAREPTVCFDVHGDHLDIPYAVIRWFMDLVEAEIRTSRDWMRLRPELVEVVRGLRQEHLGVISDEEFPAVLEHVRAGVPEEDLQAVLLASFRRRPDGTTTDDLEAVLPASP